MPAIYAYPLTPEQEAFFADCHTDVDAPLSQELAELLRVTLGPGVRARALARLEAAERGDAA